MTALAKAFESFFVVAQIRVWRASVQVPIPTLAKPATGKKGVFGVSPAALIFTLAVVISLNRVSVVTPPHPAPASDALASVAARPAGAVWTALAESSVETAAAVVVTPRRTR